MWIWSLVIVSVGLFYSKASSPADPSPHQVKNLTWIISNTVSGKIINQTSGNHPLNTWFPTLQFDLCSLADRAWDQSSYSPIAMIYGCNTEFTRSQTRSHYFYVCPSDANSIEHKLKCGGPFAFFCASWDCVSTGYIYWMAPISTDLITINKAPDSYGSCEQACNPATLDFTIQGQNPANKDK